MMGSSSWDSRSPFVLVLEVPVRGSASAGWCDHHAAGTRYARRGSSWPTVSPRSRVQVGAEARLEARPVLRREAGADLGVCPARGEHHQERTPPRRGTRISISLASSSWMVPNSRPARIGLLLYRPPADRGLLSIFYRGPSARRGGPDSASPPGRTGRARAGRTRRRSVVIGITGFPMPPLRRCWSRSWPVVD